MISIFSVSQIDRQGIESISIQIKEPYTNSRDLYEGGLILNFRNDHKKQNIKIYKYYFRNGCPRFEEKAIATIKGEIYTKEECLKFAERWKKENV